MAVVCSNGLRFRRSYPLIAFTTSITHFAIRVTSFNRSVTFLCLDTDYTLTILKASSFEADTPHSLKELKTKKTSNTDLKLSCVLVEKIVWVRLWQFKQKIQFFSFLLFNKCYSGKSVLMASSILAVCASSVPVSGSEMQTALMSWVG